MGTGRDLNPLPLLAKATLSASQEWCGVSFFLVANRLHRSLFYGMRHVSSAHSMPMAFDEFFYSVHLVMKGSLIAYDFSD